MKIVLIETFIFVKAHKQFIFSVSVMIYTNKTNKEKICVLRIFSPKKFNINDYNAH